VNQEFHALVEEDQADRRGELPAELHRRDQRRRRRVEQLLEQGTVTDPDDLFCAAEERARWEVPPLAEAGRRADEMTCDDRLRPRRQGGGP
jgi:hypothetical protein